MKTIKLTRNNNSLFKELDPFEVGASIEKGMPVAWGICKSDDEQSTPVGLVLAEAMEDELIIRWLFVAPKFREGSCGETLLSKCFHFAKKRKIEKLSVYLDTDFAKSRACLGAGDFFRAHLFQYVTMDHMVASVEDYIRQDTDPVYSIEEEAMCLYALFGDEQPEDYNPDLK